MLATNTGRALSFVQGVIDMVEKFNTDSSSGGLIQPVAKDDMVCLTERLLETQETFINEGRPYKIDLGFHYTKEGSLAQIKTDGLLTKKEINERQIETGSNSNVGLLYSQRYASQRAIGGYFGNGVYTANNPFVFQQFGNIGLLGT